MREVVSLLPAGAGVWRSTECLSSGAGKVPLSSCLPSRGQGSVYIGHWAGRDLVAAQWEAGYPCSA